MKEKDLSLYKIRTDLVADIISNIKKHDGITEKVYKEKNIKVSNIIINEQGEKLIDKKKGNYTTIFFNDVTDHNNYENVRKIFIKELTKILEQEKINDIDSCMIVGLGNEKSTPDSLGVKTSEKIIVTKHIYELFGSLEKGFRITSSFAPGVMGTTGIETSDLLLNVIKTVKPNFLIVIDALASDSIDRVCKTIQITNAGINPGSGIGNKRKEISKELIGIPVIAIGVPMVVDAVTIVSDTINFMEKHFSYNIKYHNDKKNKLIPISIQNYLLKDKELKLNSNEKNYFFGTLGGLSDFEKRKLIFDVLTPIGYNLMVTPKEVDFLIEKLTDLLSNGINKTIHKVDNI